VKASEKKVEEKGVRAQASYKELYIYMIQGTVSKRDELFLGDAFLGNWVEDNSSFLFFSRPSKESVTELVGRHADLSLADHYHFTYEQWQGGAAGPISIDRFLIIPPWEEVDQDEGLIKIILDPGVVFGNGMHPTTRDCLRALAYAQIQRPFGKVLDLGTGTGVLALAAAALGAVKVLALDLNPLCVKTAVENVRLNALDGIVRVVEGRAEDFADEPADLVVANIHDDVIKKLIDGRNFNINDRLIISGLMRSQYREVKDRLERKRFWILREWDFEMTWFTILAKKV
jgi:ribosomal protein L11 methyltransferase